MFNHRLGATSGSDEVASPGHLERAILDFGADIARPIAVPARLDLEPTRRRACWVKCSTQRCSALGSWTPACTSNNFKPREKATLDFHAKYAHRTRIDACDPSTIWTSATFGASCDVAGTFQCGRLQRTRTYPCPENRCKRPLSYSSFNSRVIAVDTPKKHVRA